MGPPTVLKGVFKEGSLIASVIQQDTAARIMLKGAELGGPSDAAFLETLRKVAEACRPHVSSFETRELCAVLLQSQSWTDRVEIASRDIAGMGLTQVGLMDGDCGILLRLIDTDPPPTPLAYGSLRAGGDMADQPGIVRVPDIYSRRIYRELAPPQQQVFGAAAQVAGRGLLQLVCLEDEGVRLAVTVRDCPPPRARTVLVPLEKLARDLSAGTSLDEIGRRLGCLRT